MIPVSFREVPAGVMVWCERSDCQQLTETPEGGNIWKVAKKGDLVVIWQGPRDEVRAFVRNVVQYQVPEGNRLSVLYRPVDSVMQVGLIYGPNDEPMPPQTPPAWLGSLEAPTVYNLLDS